MIYCLITVHVKVGKGRQFHEYWSKHLLPGWERFGTHVGSWDVEIGTGFDVIRLFGYESMQRMEEFRRFLAEDVASRTYAEGLNEFITGTEKILLRPVSYSPLK